ncbi:MAG: beta-hydroxyacyl-ACP dehydratase [Verrucomicrobia bacterium]|nr:beta-hydroxyacyl-ACP dehydratase [Verrucomicrobiota bacterium]
MRKNESDGKYGRDDSQAEHFSHKSQSSHPSHDPIALGLPHRKPFLFVDRVTHFEPGISAEGEKTFAVDDPMFAGHFPGNPVVPGVILTEALAQVAGIAGASKTGFLLSAIRAMKFPSPARPGEKILLRAMKAGSLGGLIQFSVSAQVNGQIVADGQVVLNEL